MKTRVINNKYAGNYTKNWLQENKDNIINGVLVSEWETVILYNGNFLDPLFNGAEWVEGATPEQIKENQVNNEFNLYQQRQNEGLNLYLKHEAEYRIMYLNEVITKDQFNVIEETLKPVRLELGFGQLKNAFELLKDIPATRIGVDIYNEFYSDLELLINDLYVN